MNAITQELSSIVRDAFVQCGFSETLGAVTLSDRQDLCQFQCNSAFEGAKLHRQAPIKIAQAVVEALATNPVFSKVEVIAPGFINITLADDYLIDRANRIYQDGHSGIPQTGAGSTILIDYGGPNIAKPLHVGHLRSAIIGESLKRTARMLGYKVIGDVHLGDWGMPLGLVIAELEERNPEWACFADGFDGDLDKIPAFDVDYLSEIYPFASKKSKEDEDFKARAKAITQQLQGGHKGYTALWQRIVDLSIADLKSNYSQLAVDFDIWYGESNAERYVPKLVDILNSQSLMVPNEGVMIVDISEETDNAPMPPIIIKKSDNSNLYSTTDLATLLQREEDFSPDKIWYVVDNRQKLHFTQVFRCARKAHLVPDTTELEFIGFGTMNGEDGKPYKTRDGGVMQLSDLLRIATEKSQEKLALSSYIDSLSEEEKKATARKIAVAAIKYGDLLNNRAKDYIFDLDKFLATEGKTGAYLLYTVSRVNSILGKIGADEESAVLTGLYSDVEREILLKILYLGDVFERAIYEKSPSHICESAFQLTNLFSRFYSSSSILHEADETKRSNWISLIRMVKKMVLLQLEALGIEAVNQM